MKPNPFPRLLAERQGMLRFTLFTPDATPVLTTFAGDTQAKDRAEYAAQAINSHAELVAALFHARKLIASRDVVTDRAALRMYDEAICRAGGAALLSYSPTADAYLANESLK
jgi:hypothetical protein